MLVDNAIVVVDGMLVKMQQGVDRVKAAKDVVAQTAWPLLGATLVAILAFAAIGTSQDSTGEYCRSLFQVIWISLGLSWVTAATVTPAPGGDVSDGRPAEGRRHARTGAGAAGGPAWWCGLSGLQDAAPRLHPPEVGEPPRGRRRVCRGALRVRVCRAQFLPRLYAAAVLGRLSARARNAYRPTPPRRQPRSRSISAASTR